MVDMKKISKKIKFDFDVIPDILGSGIEVIKRELAKLADISEKQGLDDSQSKVLIAYINALREVKKDHLAELAALQKELKSLSDEQLKAMLPKEQL